MLQPVLVSSWEGAQWAGPAAAALLCSPAPPCLRLPPAKGKQFWVTTHWAICVSEAKLFLTKEIALGRCIWLLIALTGWKDFSLFLNCLCKLNGIVLPSDPAPAAARTYKQVFWYEKQRWVSCYASRGYERQEVMGKLISPLGNLGFFLPPPK